MPTPFAENRMAVCIERKRLLTGGMQEYSCELIRTTGNFGILRYVIDKIYAVDSITLEPGDVTYALYWNERPYTLYIWHRRRISGVLYYFNIADSISLLPNAFTWRDLVVDILIVEDGSAHILDEEELPRDLDPELYSYINRAKTFILNRYPDIILEADGIMREIVPLR